MQVELRSRAGEPANFFPAPAPDFFQAAPAPVPAPDFFPKRLRLRLRLRFLVFFLQTAPAPRSQKYPALTGSGSGS